MLKLVVSTALLVALTLVGLLLAQPRRKAKKVRKQTIFVDEGESDGRF